MSKFNSKSANENKTCTYEGAPVYKKETADAWFNMLFSSYLEDHCYETYNTQMKRFEEYTNEMTDAYGAEFVAKAAIFSRRVLGMRSISHVLAARLNNLQFNNKRSFFRNFCNRPDDVSEVFACIENMGDKRSHAMIRGFSDYISMLSPYTLGKYKLDGHKYNMYDLINITHAHSNAIQMYKDDKLTAPDTWEVKISTAENEEHRKAEWRRLVEENKLGYMALLRNLRNILNADVDCRWIGKYLIPQIENKKAIKESLVFPYQIYTAFKYIEGFNFDVQAALEKAFRIACDNMPVFEGKTAIVLDVSGSMNDPISFNSKVTIKEVGACFAASLFLTNPMDTTFIKFGNHAMQKTLKKSMGPFNIIRYMCENDNMGYGTVVSEAFNCLARTGVDVDRIFLISDMQTMEERHYWCNSVSGYDAFDTYQKKTGNHPKVFSFDLGNYPSQIGNPKDSNVHLMTALNDKVFKIIKLLDNNVPLVDFINKVIPDNYQC